MKEALLKTNFQRTLSQEVYFQTRIFLSYKDEHVNQSRNQVFRDDGDTSNIVLFHKLLVGFLLMDSNRNDLDFDLKYQVSSNLLRFHQDSPQELF